MLLLAPPLASADEVKSPPRPGTDFDAFEVGTECDWRPCNTVPPMWISMSRTVETKSWPLATKGIGLSCNSHHFIHDYSILYCCLTCHEGPFVEKMAVYGKPVKLTDTGLLEMFNEHTETGSSLSVVLCQ